MKCALFRKLYQRFSMNPLARDEWQTAEYEQFCEHLNDCTQCGDWYLRKQSLRKGARLKAHPCVHMAYYSTPNAGSPLPPEDDPTIPVLYYYEAKCYGIPVRDGVSSFFEISHCPWCGIALIKKSATKHANTEGT